MEEVKVKSDSKIAEFEKQMAKQQSKAAEA